MSGGEGATVRRARIADQDAIGALWRDLLDEHRGLEPRFTVADDALDRWRNDFPVWLANAAWRFWVAEADGAVVGFAAAHRWAPAPVYGDDPEVFIQELYVAPAARGAGAGRHLVDAVRGWGEELGAVRVRLAVLAENAAGRTFWEAVDARPLSLTYTIELPPSTKKPVEKKGRLGF